VFVVFVCARACVSLFVLVRVCLSVCVFVLSGVLTQRIYEQNTMVVLNHQEHFIPDYTLPPL